MSYRKAVEDLEARFKGGFLDLEAYQHERDSLEYAYGEAMTAADQRNGADS